MLLAVGRKEAKFLLNQKVGGPGKWKNNILRLKRKSSTGTFFILQRGKGEYSIGECVSASEIVYTGRFGEEKRRKGMKGQGT